MDRSVAGHIGGIDDMPRSGGSDVPEDYDPTQGDNFIDRTELLLLGPSGLTQKYGKRMDQAAEYYARQARIRRDHEEEDTRKIKETKEDPEEAEAMEGLQKGIAEEATEKQDEWEGVKTTAKATDVYQETMSLHELQYRPNAAYE